MPNKTKLAMVAAKMSHAGISIKEFMSIESLIYQSMVGENYNYIQELLDCAESPQEKQKIWLELLGKRKTNPRFNFLLFDVLQFAMKHNHSEIAEFILGIKDPEVLNDPVYSELFRKFLLAKVSTFSSPHAEPLKEKNYYWIELLIRHGITIPEKVLESAVKQGEHTTQTFNSADGNELSLLDWLMSKNDKVTYQYLRTLGARHQENIKNDSFKNSRLDNCIKRTFQDSLPDYFLSNYIEDNADKDLSKLLSHAISTAALHNKPQIISQLLTRCDLIRKVDLISELEFALLNGARHVNQDVIKALLSNPTITDEVLLGLMQRTWFNTQVNVMILKNRPKIDYFLAEFFIHHSGLSTSHYWRNRQNNKNFCLDDILQHATTYSGGNTRNQLAMENQIFEKRVVKDYKNGDKKLTLRGDLAGCIARKLALYKSHNPSQYNATLKKISASMLLRSSSQESSHIKSTVTTFKLKFSNINWDTPVAVTSWSTTGVCGFFSRGKIELTLTDYVVQMHNKNREKYIKICSAMNETELAEALATHRTGFLGNTTGREIYDVVKQHGALSFDGRLDENRPNDFKISAL